MSSCSVSWRTWNDQRFDLAAQIAQRLFHVVDARAAGADAARRSTGQATRFGGRVAFVDFELKFAQIALDAVDFVGDVVEVFGDARGPSAKSAAAVPASKDALRISLRSWHELYSLTFGRLDPEALIARPGDEIEAEFRKCKGRATRRFARPENYQASCAWRLKNPRRRR